MQHQGRAATAGRAAEARHRPVKRSCWQLIAKIGWMQDRTSEVLLLLQPVVVTGWLSRLFYATALPTHQEDQEQQRCLVCPDQGYQWQASQPVPRDH